MSQFLGTFTWNCVSFLRVVSHLRVLGIIGVSKGGLTRDSGILDRGRVGGIPPAMSQFRMMKIQPYWFEWKWKFCLEMCDISEWKKSAIL